MDYLSNVWLELKYGQGGAGLTVCRLDDLQLLRTGKRTALNRAKDRLRESEPLDPVIALMDRFDLDKLETVLDALIPESVSGHGENRATFTEPHQGGRG